MGGSSRRWSNECNSVLVTNFRYGALASPRLYFIKDISVCSCRILIGVPLGNYVTILKNFI
jgi:hypothetical protein